MATSVLVGLFGEAPPSPWKALPQLLPLCAAAALAVVVAWCAARAAEWAWLRPRRLERALRAQGVRGTAYRTLSGDAALSDRLAREARSRPPLPPGCHAVVPRAMPLVHHVMNEHGKNSVTWFGPTPRVIMTEPELVRQVLSNKFGHLEKAGFGQLMRLLHYGVSTHQGSKWVKHRRIINPAFHLDKLKGMLPAFASCCADMVSRWEGLVVAAGGEPCEVDAWPEMQRLTGDVISRVAFGSSYLQGRRIFELQAEQVRLAVLVANKIHIPGYMMLPTRVNRRMKRIAAEIEGILRGMIATRESALRAGKATSDDLLGLLRRRRQLHVDRRHHRGVQAVLLRRHGDHVGAAHVDHGGALHAPGLAGPCQGGGAPRLRRRLHSAGLRRPQPPENRDHGAVRGAAALHAAAGGASADVQAHGAWGRQVPGGRAADAAAAEHPPRQGRVGAGRRRVQAGEVRGGDCQGGVVVRRPRRAGVLPVRLGASDLHWPDLRSAGGQDWTRHDPGQVRVPALPVLLARAVPRRLAQAGARRAGHAQEAPMKLPVDQALSPEFVNAVDHH